MEKIVAAAICVDGEVQHMLPPAATFKTRKSARAKYQDVRKVQITEL